MWYRTNTGERLINLENGNIIMLNEKQISFNIPHERTDTFDTEKEAQEAFEKLVSRLLNDPFRNGPVLACGENGKEGMNSEASSEIVNVNGINEDVEDIPTTDFTDFLSSRKFYLGITDEDILVANSILSVLEVEEVTHNQLKKIFSTVEFAFNRAARI